MKIFISGLSDVETTLSVRGFPITYYPVDYPFFGIKSKVAGSGYRTAQAAAALGDEVNFLTLVADDFNGGLIRQALNDGGISNTYVYSLLKQSVQSVVLQEAPYGRRQVYCDLKNAQDVYVDPETMSDVIANSDLCALLNVNYSRAFIKIAKRFGKPVATHVQALSDVNDAFNAEFIANADILFLSDEGIPTSRENFLQALKPKTQAKVIVMAAGEDGVMYCENGGDVKKLKAVAEPNTLKAGAGAALFGGFLHYYGKYDVTEALKRAEVCAALKMSANAKDCAFPTEAEIEEKLKQVAF